MAIPIATIDAFTDRPFSGNPAAVCLLDRECSDSWMQSVAMEMNLAETAFLSPAADGFDLRWFTSALEVDLCGHATLAAAHLLWETGRLPMEAQARFHTRSGLLTAVRSSRAIELDFPAERATAAEAHPLLREALGVELSYIGRNRMDWLVEVSDAAVLRGLRPDMRGLGQVPGRGIIVTSHSDVPEYDFLSRFFAPASGIDEDPVTGSAHCCLAPYWGERLGRSEMTGYQTSARGGVVGVRVEGARVKLIGRAVTVLSGELLCHE